MSSPGYRDVGAGAEAAFQEWRGKSAQLMLVLFGTATVPDLAAWFWGYTLPGRTEELVLSLVILGLVLAGVVVRSWPPVVRVWLILIVAYLVSVHGLVRYSGAMARVWLLGAPFVALILGGPRSAGVAAVASVGLILLHAAGALSGVTDGWQVAGFDESDPAVVVSRSVMWVAFFIPAFFLFRSVHLFHLRTLASERGARSSLEKEILERRVAHESLAREAAERERLEREVARVGDNERRRLGQDLHDGASQQLAVALLRCRALENRLDVEYPPGIAEVQALGTILESTMDEVHEVAHSLAPVGMDPEALGPALGALARRTAHSFGVRCEFREAGGVGLPDPNRTLDLYRIAQEAMNNAGKHARAERITVTLGGEDGHVVLQVDDDGSGLPAPAPVSGQELVLGLGLRMMAFRANRMGGTLAIEQAPGGGTRVICQVPRGVHG
jgi:signal transduction histidine kinase